MASTTEDPITQTIPAGATRHWAPRFFAIWAGEACSLLGSVLVQFALIWWFAKTTGSATALAFSSIVGLAPQVLIGPFAGALIDRWNRRVVMIVSDTLIALSTLALIGLFAANAVQLWHVYLVLFVRAVCGTFYTPAMQASTALMVPQAQLTRIAGLNQTTAAVINIASPPLGALLVAALPMTAVLAVDVGTALLAVVPLLFFSIPQPPKAAPAQTGQPLPTVWADLREGFQYVTTRRGLLMLCLLAASLNFLSAPLSALMPLLVTRHFGGEAMMLGTLTSVLGLGMLAGAVTLGVWGGFKRRIFTTLISLIGVGAGVVVLGFSASAGFSVALAAVVLMGFWMPLTNGPLDAILQVVVSPEKQARVFTLMASLAGAAMPLGLIIAGPLADRIDLPVVFTGIGLLYIIIGAAAFAIPAIVNLEKQP